MHSYSNTILEFSTVDEATRSDSLRFRGGWGTLTDVRIPPTATALEKGHT